MFREYLLVHLPVRELAVGFRDGHGRPSKDLAVALGALILQQLHDLTDQQTSEAVALNIAWYYALDIRHEPDAYLCERTVRNYRTRLMDAGLEEVLFRTLTDQLIEKVGVDTRRQRLDSTTVKSAIRGLTRLGILVEAVSKFLRELKRKERALYVWMRRYFAGTWSARATAVSLIPVRVNRKGAFRKRREMSSCCLSSSVIVKRRSCKAMNCCSESLRNSVKSLTVRLVMSRSGHLERRTATPSSARPIPTRVTTSTKEPATWCSLWKRSSKTTRPAGLLATTSRTKRSRQSPT